jgi:Uncharacterized ACR, COG1430
MLGGRWNHEKAIDIRLPAVTIHRVADQGLANRANLSATHCSLKPVRYVLEMNHGWFTRKGIKPGASFPVCRFLANNRA